jgi:Arc/MetJ family transcription regulator
MAACCGNPSIVMKTTLDIDDTLLLRAKQAALDRNTTLRAIVEDALARALGPAADADVPVRTLTFPPDLAKSAPRLDSDSIDAAIAAERSDPADAPRALSRRMGALDEAGPRR